MGDVAHERADQVRGVAADNLAESLIDLRKAAVRRKVDPSVFERVHAFAFELISRGYVDGMRIDHVDGLFDPGDYLRRLRQRAAATAPNTNDPTESTPMKVCISRR